MMINVLFACAILALTWYALRLKKIFMAKRFMDRFGGKKSVDPGILSKIFTVGVIFFGGMMALHVLGIDVIPLLTLSGIGAAAVGFASKDLIANFFGGMMIYVTRSFHVNDFIELPEKKISGTVEDIGWYITTVRDMNRRCLYVPNSVFSTEFVLNHSTLNYRRIEERVRIHLADTERLKVIVNEIREALKQRPEIEPFAEVFLVSVGPWGAEIGVNAFTKVVDYELFLRLKQDVLLDIHRIAYLKDLV